MKKVYLSILLSLACGITLAQSKDPAHAFPGLINIKDADLRKDLFELAADAFRGRRTGTIDELRAATWTAQKAQEAGLKPAGDDGTYFQFVNLRRTRLADNSTFSISGHSLTLWKDCYESSTPVEAHFDTPVTWLNSLTDTAQNISGKVVAMRVEPPKPLPYAQYSLWSLRYVSSALRQIGLAMRRHNAAGLILVADSVTTDALNTAAGHNFKDGQYTVEGLNAPPRTPLAALPLIIVNTEFGPELQKAGATAKADLRVISYLYPTVNVVAKAPGTDAALKNQYVLFSGHHDHDGVWRPVGQDSIYNGADDNASVTVGMLAIGRAWVAHPGKRPALFVWHGAEERGLLGSKYYAAHPTVKKEDIVAVINADMIGRNPLDSAALLGVLPPHRNSTALVNLALEANNKVTHFKIDTSWDDVKHPENWYFRSDHASYAAVGIPALMYSSLLHPQYHTVKDNPETIDIAKLAKMTKWMYATGWLVSQSAQRVALDKQGDTSKSH